MPNPFSQVRRADVGTGASGAAKADSHFSGQRPVLFRDGPPNSFGDDAYAFFRCEGQDQEKLAVFKRVKGVASTDNVKQVLGEVPEQSLHAGLAVQIFGFLGVINGQGNHRQGV